MIMKTQISIKDHFQVTRLGTILIILALFISPGLTQTTWTGGAMDSDWENPGNWTAGKPTASVDAIIPSTMGLGTPIIQSNTMAEAKSVTITSGGTLVVNADASLTIDGSTGHGITSSGSIVNFGSIIIGSNLPITLNGIRVIAGTLNNDGIIEIDNTVGAAFANIAGTCSNQGQIKIGDLGPINNFGLVNRASFTNQAGGRIDIFNSKGLVTETASADFKNLQSEIRIENTDSNGLKISGGTYQNAGSTFIFGVMNTSINTALRVDSGATFTNDPCGILAIDDNINNGGSIVNQGQININTIESHIVGSFTNNGTIEDIFNTFPTASVTNNELVIARTVTTSSASAIPNAFQIGSSPNFTVVGVFIDFTASTPAGTYDQMTNTFTAMPDLPLGITTLSVQVTDPAGGCDRIVGWPIDNRACTSTCFAGVDRCWNVSGPSDEWSDPYNWCPYGVPTTGEWVELPTGAIVQYNYGGTDVVSRVDVKTGAVLTINAGRTLEIENEPNCTFCSMLVNEGTVTNQGTIDLRNGQFHGIQNIGTCDNYGSIMIDGSGLRVQGFSGLYNEGIFNNHPDANIEIMNAQGPGLYNSLAPMTTNVFTNFANANISIHDVQGVGLTIEGDTFFENKMGGVIDIFNISNLSDKLDIQIGAEVLWNSSVDIK